MIMGEADQIGFANETIERRAVLGPQAGDHGAFQIIQRLFHAAPVLPKTELNSNAEMGFRTQGGLDEGSDERVEFTLQGSAFRLKQGANEERVAAQFHGPDFAPSRQGGDFQALVLIISSQAGFNPKEQQKPSRRAS
jgi:hypothetical protein